MGQRPNFPAYVALAAVCLIWGTTYLVLRIGVMHFPPFLFVAIRQTIAGLILIGFIAIVSKIVWPSAEHIIRQAIGGFFMISLGNGLVAWAEMHIPSGIAAIICSLMPVLVILINLSVHKEERPTVPIMLGVALGMVGILLIFSENIAEFSKPEYILGIFLTFIAALSWAAGSIWIKKKNTETNLFLNAGLQMFFGGIWLFPMSFALDDLRVITWSAEAVYSMVYLTLIGSIVAYVCYSYALRKLPMTIVSLYAYVNPLVAVLLGWVILNEKLNAKIGFAFLLTVAGIYIVNKGYQLRKVWKEQFR